MCNDLWNVNKPILEHLFQPKAAIYRSLSVAPDETNLDVGAVNGNCFGSASGSVEATYVVIRIHVTDYEPTALTLNYLESKRLLDLLTLIFSRPRTCREDRAILGPNAACVDYSAGKGGPLVAYQWSGETELADTHFVSYG